MAESIVRISRELEEAQAQIAVYEAERSILMRERDEAREQYRSTHALAEVLVTSRNQFLEALRDIAKMDTSQDASPTQCAAVWRAMEALK